MRLSRRDFLAGLSAAAAHASCTPLPPPRCSLAATSSCPAPDPLPTGIPMSGRCDLFAFDEVHRATPTVYHPASESDLATLLKAANTGRPRRVTIRGGGQAMDSQSLNADLVFILDAACFTRIGEPVHGDDGFHIEVGAGALWTNVVAQVARYGLMPPSLVTAPSSTVGGTLSSDCLSRMSCIVGKEGKQIRKLWMVLPDGSPIECRRDDDNADRLALFNAVIGGFGYLGAVTRVSFDLVVARSSPAPMVAGLYPCVFTRSTRSGPSADWDAVLRALQSKSVLARDSYLRHPEVHRGVRSKSVPEVLAKAPEWSALSVASFLTGEGISANLLEQRYVDPQRLHRFPGGVYQAANTFPPEAELGNANWPTLIDLALDFCPEGEFVDDLFGWAFFLGNSTAPAKNNAHDQGKRLNITQQSFALPAGQTCAVDTRATRRFIELLEARLHTADLQPVAIDFLYIPEDAFLMSASRGLTSFVVTVSFTEIDRVHSFSRGLVDTLHALSNDCRMLGGRVHLVKGVNADPGDLRAMYGDAAHEFLALKRRYDPNDILRNEFFERVFLA